MIHCYSDTGFWRYLPGRKMLALIGGGGLFASASPKAGRCFENTVTRISVTVPPRQPLSCPHAGKGTFIWFHRKEATCPAWAAIRSSHHHPLPSPHSQPLPWRPQAGISLRYPPFWRYFGLFFLPSTRGAPFSFCLPNPAVFFKKRCNTYQCISLNLHGINASK